MRTSRATATRLLSELYPRPIIKTAIAYENRHIIFFMCPDDMVAHMLVMLEEMVPEIDTEASRLAIIQAFLRQELEARHHLGYKGYRADRMRNHSRTDPLGKALLLGLLSYAEER